MFKNRFLLILAAISLMTVTVAISRPLSKATASTQPASSSIGSPAFYEYRRGEWSTNATVALAPVTGSPATVERTEAELRLWSGEVFLSDNNQPDHMQNVQTPASQNLERGCFSEDSQPRPQSGCVE